MLIISRADNMRVGISALPIIPSLTGGAEAEAGDYEIYLSWLAEFLLHKGTEVHGLYLGNLDAKRDCGDARIYNEGSIFGPS